MLKPEILRNGSLTERSLLDRLVVWNTPVFCASSFGDISKANDEVAFTTGVNHRNQALHQQR